MGSMRQGYRKEICQSLRRLRGKKMRTPKLRRACSGMRGRWIAEEWQVKRMGKWQTCWRMHLPRNPDRNLIRKREITDAKGKTNLLGLRATLL